MFNKVVKVREKVAFDMGAEDHEKPFLEHLEDLRTMLVRMAITLTLFAGVAFVFYEKLMKVIFYPLEIAGIRDKVNLMDLKPIGPFMAAMNVSIAVGIILACPLLLYFLLQFILPGLRAVEKKVIFPALGVGVGLFLCGACFAFFVVAPKALGFFYEFNNTVVASPVPVQPPVEIKIELSGGSLTVNPAAGGPSQVIQLAGGILSGTQSIIIKAEAPKVNQPYSLGISDFVKFITQFVLIFGLCFELPVVVMALVKLDILTYKVMSATRGYAIIAIAVVSAVIAPTPDVFTLGLIAGPMIILYEICIWLSWYLDKKDRAANPDYYKGLDEDEKALSNPDEWDNDSYNPWNDDRDDDLEDIKPKPSPSPSGTVPAADPFSVPTDAAPPVEKTLEDYAREAESHTGNPPEHNPEAHQSPENNPPGDFRLDHNPEGESKNTD